MNRGEPTPAEADPTGERYCFERGARKDILERIEAHAPAAAPTGVAFVLPEEQSVEDWTAAVEARNAGKPTNGAH